MTFKSLLIRLFWTGVVLGAAIGTHVFLTSRSELLAEKMFAPKYVQPTDDVAYAKGSASHDALVAETNEKTEVWNRCVETHDPEYVFVCHTRPDEVQPVDRTTLIENGQRMARWVFENNEVEPHVDSVKNGINLVFGILYAGLALLTGRTLFTWFVTEPVPAILRMMSKVKVALPVAMHVKEMKTSRKLRRTENDFTTLKNLFDNGLITEEVFLKRKDELKAVLSEEEA
jgi:uncharacterized membrane protein